VTIDQTKKHGRQQRGVGGCGPPGFSYMVLIK